MIDLSLNKEEIQLLYGLMNAASVEVIWDINAFYFNSELKTYNLECFDEKPEGSDYEYDEIFFCRFEELPEFIDFSNKDSNYWFKVISTDCRIISINCLNVIQLFPGNSLILSKDIGEAKTGLNKLTLGLIIETDKGFLPAFLLPSNHGFTWQPKYEFYSKSEVDNLVKENIKIYELINGV